jgi:L-ribulose-5-phosphate 3-epimerase
MQSRRQFISKVGYGFGACSLALGTVGLAQGQTPDDAAAKAPRLRKSLKFYMVQGSGSIAEKFAIAKDAGYEGVELDTPGINIEQANEAAKSTGLFIDGTVCNNHWQVRHTDPDPAVRASALKSCIAGLRETAALGGDTMLLVAGHGQDGSPKEIFDRAVANIRLAIPVAEEVGIKIAIENVWNHFMYDHEGGTDQTADELARFIDTFDSPWVGVQFDIGNHWKYGDPAGWIRTLGKRIIKLDVKGYSRAKNGWTQMAASDIDWKSVREALAEVDFKGWVAAEMGAGNLDYLKQVSKEMDELLVVG